VKALVQTRYGSTDLLELRDVDRPQIGEGDILVRVRAASVNPLDWHDARGEPYFLRLGSGLFTPKPRILGVDLAGVVEAVGESATGLKVGDEVFGVCRGALAEFACGPPDKLVTKPAGLSFEQAAAVPVPSVVGAR